MVEGGKLSFYEWLYSGYMAESLSPVNKMAINGYVEGTCSNYLEKSIGTQYCPNANTTCL